GGPAGSRSCYLWRLSGRVGLAVSRRMRALMITSQRASIWSSVRGGSARTLARMAALSASVSSPVGGRCRGRQARAVLPRVVVGLVFSFLAVDSACSGVVSVLVVVWSPPSRSGRPVSGWPAGPVDLSGLLRCVILGWVSQSLCAAHYVQVCARGETETGPRAVTVGDYVGPGVVARQRPSPVCSAWPARASAWIRR